jgi:hypothetical protein
MRDILRVKLERVAHVRSGDKGNTSNIAVIAYCAEFYPLLKAQLTAARFKEFYRGAIKGDVTRFEADNLAALNFVAEGALGGGVSRSLSLDNYGKAMSAAILGFEISAGDICQSAARRINFDPYRSNKQRWRDNVAANRKPTARHDSCTRDAPARTAVNLALLVLLATLWGAAYTLVKVGVETIPPLTLISGRR